MDFEIIDLKQNTKKWLDFRHNHIGASDANIILGLSRYCTRSKLLEIKRNKSTDDITSYAAALGHKIEEKKRPAVAFEFNLDLKPMVLRHIKMPISCSLDGYDLKKNIPWEHKLLGKEDYDNSKLNIFPAHYKPQAQQQLFITKAEYLLFSITNWHNHNETIHLKVFPDFEYQNILMKEIGKFYSEIFSEEKPFNKKLRSLLKEYNSVEIQMKNLSEQKNSLREEIFNLIPEKKYEIDGIKISESDPISRKSVDYKKIVVDNNVNIEDYTTLKTIAPKRLITFPTKNEGV